MSKKKKKIKDIWYLWKLQKKIDYQKLLGVNINDCLISLEYIVVLKWSVKCYFNLLFFNTFKHL